MPAHVPLHGRDHLRGGADPIPHLLEETGGFPTMYHYSLGLAINGHAGNHWEEPIFDSNQFGGVKLINVTAGSGDVPPYDTGAELFFGPFWFGPKGSIWRLQLIFEETSASGKLKIEFASIQPHPTIEGRLERMDTSGTFLLAQTVNFYNASTNKNRWWKYAFVLEGEDGDDLTGINPTGTDYDLWDAGAGYYVMRFSVGTRDASSSGDRLAISDVFFKRLDARPTLAEGGSDL